MNSTLSKRVLPCATAIALAFGAGTVIANNDNENSRAFHARLTGYQEVPAVSTPARGEFKGKIDKRTGWIDYEFSYEGLQGTARQAHIHFGQHGVNGGIVVWLCDSANNPSPLPSTPECTSPAGSFTGVIKPENITPNAGAVAQLISPAALEAFLAAIRAGAAYVNVHTGPNAANGSTGVPGGEIRGQLRPHP